MRKTILLVALLFISSIATAQKTIIPKEDYKNISVVSPSGSSFKNEEVSINWTLGNTLYSLSEENIEEIPSDLIDLSLSIKAFPNPLENNLIIASNVIIKESLNIIVFDAIGKILLRKVMTKNKYTLSLKHLPSALYLIKIVNSKDQHVKTFRIIKN